MNKEVLLILAIIAALYGVKKLVDYIMMVYTAVNLKKGFEDSALLWWLVIILNAVLWGGYICYE